ncbi:MAG TPA: 2-oxoglutarate dehydrogenase E1 component, partial [Hyphomicrobiaceae bacterium]|nr:2-oxoglutarate dehydrogenase E1 component [Hyphomicrobiaceae bacterium]
MTRQPKNEAFAQTSFLQGANAAYIEEMQAQYERNPGSVTNEWRHFFASLKEERAPQDGNGHGGPSWAKPLASLQEKSELLDALTGDWGGVERGVRDRLKARAQAHGVALDPIASVRATQDSIRALMLIRAYRVMGHLAADLDPLGLVARKMHKELRPETYGFTEADLDRPIFIDKVLGLEIATVREILKILRRTYCRHIGVEFMHITSPAQKSWLQERIEGRDKDITFTVEGKKAILNKLIEAETFEKFADVKYTGTKRFGLDGAESMVPALEQIIKRGGQLGVKEIVIGMAHRGRLNVLANVLSKPLRAIFNEFKGGSFKPDDVDGSGDVKYHLGASADRAFDGNSVHLSLTANPSHLEIVDPVVLGKVRAKQDQHGCKPGERTPVLPLLIHGDAAFAGQGVVAECFGLSGLKGHRTGGSIHFIINNQIGFTTNPGYSRSSPYCSDVAKMVEAPIFHVNGDNPETVVHVAKIATEFRQRFQKPVVIDMFCYRRHGHNESDEPAFTQPLMYRAIKAHPSTVEIYAKRLIEEGVVTAQDVAGMTASFRARLDEALAAADSYKPNKADWLDGRWSDIGFADDEARRGQTGVAIDTLKEVGRRITSIPQDFHAHKTIQRLLQRRREMVESGLGIDWAMAEHLAFGTLLNEGFPVRLSGQDSERGTFSQRHSVLFDQESERRYTPLKYVAPGQGRFEVINSMLSEEAVLAFEYGYTLAEPNALTMWEAQFGDFANGAQVVFDQFISSGERKWLRMSGLVCLLPHGYEGQGPEHSSARLERFLQLCAEDNWQVANCTTPANYFHILRRQLHRKFRKPLVIMTPKSLLRHKRVLSRLVELGPGTSFHRVLWDDAQLTPEGGIHLRPDRDIRRVVLCSGKVYWDLYEAREAAGIDDVYLM